MVKKNLIKYKKIRLNLKYKPHREAIEIIELAQQSPLFKSGNDFIVEAIIAYKHILTAYEEDNDTGISASNPNKNDFLEDDKLIIEEPSLL